MNVKPLKLKGSFEIQLIPKGDNRGYFMRSYDREIFAEHGLQTAWIQENQSLSTRINTIRGLHFLHPPHTETKLIRVMRGKILDVFVDLRKDSETFGQWDSIELSEDNHKSVYIPKGFAHGFLTLSDVVLVQYKV
ncbi:MAG: dTDP-4-dehydrorhamnose 3,5-epimerase family protein, partial [Acidobacteria bacterium]|nr:dTDP-4-dehydrorhamnose 3,5-epimerase family protein [Acidobacteriota bacterium]